MIEAKVLSRRTVLRGLGTALALPFLDAMLPGRAMASVGGPAAGAGSGVMGAPPVRMAFVFVPNGINMQHWTPATQGRDFQLPRILEPLAKVRDSVNVLTGLAQDKGRANGDGAGDHARSASVFLTGAQPYKTPGAEIRSGISVDQVAAAFVGKETRFPSLELACEKGGNTGNCDSGYSCAYSHNISWRGPSTPMAKEYDPRRVFDRLFGGEAAAPEVAASRARRTRERKSILDFVLSDARRLSGEVGSQDRRKVDEYLSGIREIEKRIERGGKPDGTPEVELPESLARAAGEAMSFEEHIRLLYDMMVLSFQTDTTRVATFMIANAGSNRNYRFIDIPDGHHDLSHHEQKREKLDKIREINRFHLTQFAYFLERLQAIEEGDGTLLDNCMIVYGSGLGDGNRHNHDNLPVLLAGEGGRTIDSGRHIVYPDETPLCNLFVSMLARIGAPVGTFSDSTGPLRHLTV